MISKALAKKIAAYSVMAETFMLCHQKADAQIIYTDVVPDLVINNSFFNLDLNNDGVTDFKLKNRDETAYNPNNSCNPCGGILSGFYQARFYIPGNGQVALSNYGSYARALAFGDTVKPSNSFGDGYGGFNFGLISSSWFGGSFTCGGSSYFNTFNIGVIPFSSDAYLGFKTTSGAQNYYGWARIRIGSNNVITLKDYAINSIPDSSIITGDTSGVGCITNNITNSPDGHFWMCSNSADVQLFNAGAQSIQWMENGTWISGANDSVYTVNHAGIYQALVSDATCAVLVNAVSIDTVNLGINFMCIQNETCGNVNGDIILTVTGNQPAFTYSWSNGATTQFLESVPAGTYEFIVNSPICVTSDTFEFVINNIPGPTSSETHIDASCNNNDGSINLTINGGTPPYVFHWNNNANTEDLNNLSSGNYSVTVSDHNQCITTLATLINAGTLPNPVIFQTGNILNTYTYFFSYQWFLNNNPITGATNYQYSPLQAGTYKVEAIDTNGCVGFSIDFNFVPEGVRDIINGNGVTATLDKDKKLTFHLANNDLMGAQIDILNELGARVTTVTVSNQTPSADLSNMAAGIYFYHIRSKQKTYSGKFLIE